MESQVNLYLYCFFKPTASISPISPQKGIDGASDTFVLSYRELCALVSSVPVEEYNEEILNRQVENLEWLIPKAKRHDEVIRSVMEFHPVIPVRFGAIYTSEARVIELLKYRYDSFCSFLDFISDKEEWGVKVYAGEGASIKATEASKEIMAQLDKKISSATPGEAHLLRKKRGNLLRQQSLGLLNRLSDQLYQQLSSWSVEGRRNKPLSKRATGKEEDMILNAAFLLNKRTAETFKEEVDALAESYLREGLSFEISGPWPCYNFCPEFSR